MGDYHVLMQFDIDADPDVVRRALETEDGIRAWWSKRTDLDGDGLRVSFPDVRSRSSSRSATARTDSTG